LEGCSKFASTELQEEMFVSLEKLHVLRIMSGKGPMQSLNRDLNHDLVKNWLLVSGLSCHCSALSKQWSKQPLGPVEGELRQLLSLLVDRGI